MERNELPLGFSLALGQNPKAMLNFSLMTEAQKTEILQRARSVNSRENMQALVNEMSSSVSHEETS